MTPRHPAAPNPVRHYRYCCESKLFDFLAMGYVRFPDQDKLGERFPFCVGLPFDPSPIDGVPEPDVELIDAVVSLEK